MKTLILNNFARLINSYLQLDPQSKDRLNRLNGRVLAIELMPLHFIFQIKFAPTGIVMTEGGDEAAETIIRGTPIQMVNILLSQDKRSQFVAEKLEILGNAELAQQVTQILTDMDIDWEEQLAKVTGDTVSHNVSRLSKQLKNWYQRTTDSVREDISDYFQEEKGWSPHKKSMTDFYQDIDQLRMDVDRLEARVNRLREQIESHQDEEIS